MCDGLGTTFEVDPELVVPDPDLSVSEGALAPWASGHAKYFHRLLESVCESEGIDPDVPFEKLRRRSTQTLLLYGLPGDDKVNVRFRNRYGRTRTLHRQVRGRHPLPEAAPRGVRERLGPRGRSRATCARCPARPATGPGSTRWRWPSPSTSSTCTSCARCPSPRPAKRLLELHLDDRQALIAERILKEINARLQFLCDVGLDYLNLERSAATLSGGEAQRIRLASQIGSGLVGVLYVLDEPSIGLHQRDNHKLIETLERLRDLGNTVLVVEHDEDTIRVADHVVDIGPGAGEHGGRGRPRGHGQAAAADQALDHRAVPVRASGPSRCPSSVAQPGDEWLA